MVGTRPNSFISLIIVILTYERLGVFKYVRPVEMLSRCKIHLIRIRMTAYKWFMGLHKMSCYTLLESLEYTVSSCCFWGL